MDVTSTSHIILDTSEMKYSQMPDLGKIFNQGIRLLTLYLKGFM